MKKKILFINPFNKSSLIQSQKIPSLSLISLISYTDKNLWDIEIIDEVFDDFVFKEVDLVAITAFTSNINRAYEIAQEYKKNGIYTVIGGYHATFMFEEAMQHVDSVIIGEAEITWPIFLEDFLRGFPQKLYNGQPVDLLNLKAPSHNFTSNKYNIATVQTSRGCPFNCNFCCVTKMAGSKFRQRPIDNIIEELKSIKKSVVFFADDNLIGSSKKDYSRAKELFLKMIDSNLNKTWYGYASLNVVEDEELLNLAKRSGCVSLVIGIDSENILSLRSANKTQNIKIQEKYTIKKAIDIIHKAGISVNSNFIFGFDSDTEKDLNDRLKFILKSNIDIITIMPLAATPGSDLFNTAKSENRLKYTDFPEDWAKYQTEQPTLIPRKISIDFLTEFLNKATRKIYSRINIQKRYYRTLYYLKDISIANNCKSINYKHRDFFLKDN